MQSDMVTVVSGQATTGKDDNYSVSRHQEWWSQQRFLWVCIKSSGFELRIYSTCYFIYLFIYFSFLLNELVVS